MWAGFESLVLGSSDLSLFVVLGDFGMCLCLFWVGGFFFFPLLWTGGGGGDGGCGCGCG